MEKLQTSTTKDLIQKAEQCKHYDVTFTITNKRKKSEIVVQKRSEEGKYRKM